MTHTYRQNIKKHKNSQSETPTYRIKVRATTETTAPESILSLQRNHQIWLIFCAGSWGFNSRQSFNDNSPSHQRQLVGFSAKSPDPKLKCPSRFIFGTDKTTFVTFYRLGKYNEIEKKETKIPRSHSRFCV